MTISDSIHVEGLIRDIPNYPRPGIVFKDLTPVMRDAKAFQWVVENLTNLLVPLEIEAVVGVEARGFVFGAVVAHQAELPFVPVRKPGKLPGSTASVEYELEYGIDSLEIHVDALSAGAQVAIVDDVLATGGTATACADLVTQIGATPVALLVLLELGDLGGRSRLDTLAVHSLLLQ